MRRLPDLTQTYKPAVASSQAAALQLMSAFLLYDAFASGITTEALVGLNTGHFGGVVVDALAAFKYCPTADLVLATETESSTRGEC